MIISQNTTTEFALNSNKKAGKAVSKAGSRLQTGLRIQTAADDCAGLGISEKMRAQIRGLAQAARNIQDGISLVQTADGALGSLQEPTLQRMRELVVQAANDTLTPEDRKKIQNEIGQLNKHLDDIFKGSEFNTQKIFVQMPPQVSDDQIVPGPGILTGDTILHNSGLVVTAGENQTMTFQLDGASYSIALGSGSYNPQQLLDEINQQLAAAGTDVTASYSGDNIAFNSPTRVLDSFGGDMVEINNPYTSILYDMAKHGLITGASIQGYGSLAGGATIMAGQNDTLTFQVDGTPQSITLAAGSYDQAGLLHEINDELTAAGINVTASYTAGNQLKLMHNISGAGHTLTGVGGNAFPDLFQTYTTLQESIYSSSYTTAGITGTKNLSAGLTIISGQNDTLTFAVDGVPHSVVLAAGTNVAFTSIINDLNNQFATGGLPLVAGSSSGRLTIAYNAPGTHSVDNFQGNACDDLLYGTGAPYVQQGSYYYVEGDSTPLPNGYAYVRGVTDLTGGASVIAGSNDTFNFRLDGSDYTITLDPGVYSQSGFLAEINSKLTGLNVTAYYTSSYPAAAVLCFSNTHEGGGSAQFPYSLDNFSGSGYDAFMKTLIPVPTAGTDTKARVYGQANLSAGMTIVAGSNDILNFKIGGTNKSITLTAGTYTAATLLTELNTQLAGVSAGGVAGYSGNMLLLTAVDSGKNLDSFSGNAVESLLRKKAYVGWASYSLPSATDAYVEGRLDLSSGVTIDKGANDTLHFNIDGVSHSITLAEGYYSSATLLTAFNDKLADFQVSASFNAKNQLRLTYSPGINGSFVIDGVGGSASYTLFYPGPKKIISTLYDAEPLKSTNTLKLHIGANAGVNLNTGIPIFMSTRILGVQNVTVETQQGAEASLMIIDQAIGKVSAKRADMGSLQNSLQYTLNNVTQYNEQLTDAEAKLRDADVAKELLEMTKGSILEQVSTAMLTRSAQEPERILQLLE